MPFFFRTALISDQSVYYATKSWMGFTATLAFLVIPPLCSKATSTRLTSFKREVFGCELSLNVGIVFILVLHFLLRQKFKCIYLPKRIVSSFESFTAYSLFIKVSIIRPFNFKAALNSQKNLILWR